MNSILILNRFLLAQLHMDSLNSQPTIGHIKKSVKNLPRGIKGLDATYKEALARIDGQEEELSTLGRRVLVWVTHAKTELKVTALVLALAIEVNTTELDLDFCPDADLLGSICAGLVVISQEGDTIRLVHYTTKEYFERTSAFPTAEKDIAEACITYLGYVVGPTLTQPWIEEMSIRPRELDKRNYRKGLTYLEGYVNAYWAKHVHISRMDSDERVIQLLRDDKTVRTMAFHAGLSLSSSTGLEICAIYGFSQAASILIELRKSTEESRAMMNRALRIAASYNQDTVIRALLDCEDVDPNSTNGRRSTALHQAVEFNSRKAVDILLTCSKIDINASDYKNRSPLYLAALTGNVEIVRILLSNGARVDDVRITPENAMVFKESIFRLFFEYGADPNRVDILNRGYISYAAVLGLDGLVRTLISAGASADIPDKSGRTPISYAVEKGWDSTVRLLTEAGARPDIPDNDGLTPIGYASANKHQRLRQFLLEKGGSSERMIKDREFALVDASYKGHTSLVATLLRYGISPNTLVDLGKRTPLSYAAEFGHHKIVTMLLQNGALPNFPNEPCWLPIAYAAFRGHEQIVLDLIEHGAELDKPDQNGVTPLAKAALSGHEEIVSLLIDKGAKIDSLNYRGKTPLGYATERNHKHIVQLLLKRGADPLYNGLKVVAGLSQKGTIPLMVAVEKGYADIVELIYQAIYGRENSLEVVAC
jgi:ankyrin repeat protein